MKTKWIKWICSCLIIFTLTACSAPTVEPTTDSSVIGTIVALNVQLTQAAATLTSVIAQQSATPLATSTPSFTATPNFTPTLTATPTELSGLWLTFDQNTNCRTGPGTYYPILSVVEAGNRLQAIAQSPDGEFYYVNYFDTSNHYCWVWKQTAYQSGNTNHVQVYTVQPTSTATITPTSAANFSISYNSVQSCSSAYSLLFTIKNTGYLTWQSVKIVIVDNTSSVTVTHTSNSFIGYEGCAATQAQGDLTTGEAGTVSNYEPGQFSYDPTGHSLGVTVSLYSSDDLAGTVITKSFSVTP